jgi:hypothetical protein
VAVVKCMSLSEVKKRSIAGVNRPSQDDGVGIVCVKFVVVLNDTQQVHPSVGSSKVSRISSSLPSRIAALCSGRLHTRPIYS